MIYMDNAATTWPKPEMVYRAVDKTMRDTGANPGRGGYSAAYRAGEVVADTRKKLSRLFNIKDASRLAFMPNATYSINTVLKGILKRGDHVIATVLEHNSTLRPLYKLSKRGIELSIVTCSPEGFIDPLQIKKEIKKNTKLVCLNHASNVLGTITPIKEVGSMVRERGPYLLVDAAQTAGLYPLDVEEMNIDFLVFPGHKSILGPQGTGGLYVREGIDLESLVEGGTGSQSYHFQQPDKMPDKLESGTPNTPGIAGLGAGIDFIRQEGMSKIRIHELELTKYMLEGLGEIKGVKIYGPQNIKYQTPLVAFNINQINSEETSFILDHIYNIATRAGIHCAPLVHRHLGTIEQGAVRASLGYFNTLKDVEKLICAVEAITGQFLNK